MTNELWRIAEVEAKGFDITPKEWLRQAIALRQIVYLCQECLGEHPIAAMYAAPHRVCWCAHHARGMKGSSKAAAAVG